MSSSFPTLFCVMEGIVSYNTARWTDLQAVEPGRLEAQRGVMVSFGKGLYTGPEVVGVPASWRFDPSLKIFRLQTASQEAEARIPPLVLVLTEQVAAPVAQ